jgi:hypothetical protein
MGTAYYVDQVNGDDGYDGLAPVLNGSGPWKSIEFALVYGYFSPGDIIWVRCNQTHTVASSVTNLIDGTAALPIEVKADDGTVTAWNGDSRTVKPKLDWSATNTRYLSLFKNYWRFEGLHFYNTYATSTYGHLKIGANGIGYRFKNCKFEKHNKVSDDGVNAILYEDCEFVDTVADLGTHLTSTKAAIICKRCSFDGGAVNRLSYALNISYANAYFEDCVFGGVYPSNGADVLLNAGSSRVFLRNCKHNGTPTYGWAQVSTGAVDAIAMAEDYNQVRGASRNKTNNGEVIKDTGVLHSGGADSSAKVSPSGAHVTTLNPMTISNELGGGDFKLWLPAAAATVTIYIRSIDTWGGVYPTAAQLFVQAEYLSDGTTGARALSTASTQVLSDATTWVAFTTTFTPAAEGWVYVKVYLGKYNAGSGIYVDIQPVVS